MAKRDSTPALPITWQTHQELALSWCYEVDEILLGGNRGGGKSRTLLGAWACHLDQAGKKAKYCNGLIIRKKYKDLEQLIKLAKEIFGGRAHFRGGSPSSFEFDCGAKVTFAFLRNEDDVLSYQGHEFTFLGIDEAANIPDPSVS